MRLHFEATQRYVQSSGLLASFGEYVSPFGYKFAIIADSVVKELIYSSITRSFRDFGITARFVDFGGECHRDEISRLTMACRGVDAVVGAGGGKAIDAAKLVGYNLSLPIITCPTLASTDAPVSRVAVLNRIDGSVDEVVILPQSPSLVAVDSYVVSQAPVRFLAAGIGDAMSTWFEARACQEAGGTTLFGGRPSWAGLALAHQCWENLRKWALPALSDAEKGIVSLALETVIETNILLSGLGFENGGLALAHAIHNGLTQLSVTRRSFHGEKVAFGLLVQCIVEDASETEEILSLLAKIGLPVTLEELGVVANLEPLRTVVDYVFSHEQSKLKNEPVEVNPELLLSAILEADSLGRAVKKRG